MALQSDSIVYDARTVLQDEAPHAEMRSNGATPRRDIWLTCLRPLRLLIAFITRELRVYRLITRDSRTPRGPKVLLWIAVAYAVWPLGLVPDLIPIVGYVDDIIIVPILVVMAMRNVPREVILDCRTKACPSGS